MSYEVYERKAPRLKTPTFRFSKIGTIIFNQTAATFLKKEDVNRVLVLFDKTARRIALKTTADERDARAYSIHYNEKGNGASFSAKTFLDYINVDYKNIDTRPIAIDLNFDENFLIEADIPASFFAVNSNNAIEHQKG